MKVQAKKNLNAKNSSTPIKLRQLNAVYIKSTRKDNTFIISKQKPYRTDSCQSFHFFIPDL